MPVATRNVAVKHLLFSVGCQGIHSDVNVWICNVVIIESANIVELNGAECLGCGQRNLNGERLVFRAGTY